ncbi:MAG: malic enzyme-like NAD(P)-binding protein [Parachlamydiales bacterium]|jgi:malate dehydrogenase (oxaloacetate-decarboxylating)(NADP+)
MPKSKKIPLEKILTYHLGGKIGLLATKKLRNQKDLSLAYTPGVAEVCKLIETDPEKIFDYTAKQNTVAVVTDGTAVLGLGNIGARASLPVMEGKAVLFKAFAGVDAWPVPLEGVLNSEGKTDPEKCIQAIKNIALMYGGINLEDIAAPACFEIEERLDRELEIPVFHDDQWGTAIIALAALKNYFLVSGKKPENLKIVINGAGAAGIRIADTLKTQSIGQLIMCDSKGTLHLERTDLNPHKKRHALQIPERTLEEALRGADVFIGVSKADVLTPQMLLSMNSYPAIFAMANPNPEIKPEIVSATFKNRPYVLATGRSDYPNQINNVLGFPYIFRGALDVRASTITMNMKLAAAEALAQLAREKEIPEIVKKAYKREFEFGPDYLIPTPFDPRINLLESKAVAEAAIKDGVSKIKSLPEKYQKPI